MPINTISQTISTIPEAGHRGIDVQTQFVIKQEDFQDHLQGTTVNELNNLKSQINTTVIGMNEAVTTVNTKASEASASASSASTSANTATTKAEEASVSASSASTSATKAEQWANANYNVQVETGKYSAKHWSTVAQNTVTNKVDKVTSTDNAVVRFNGITGEVQNSDVIIDDNGNIGVGGGTTTNGLIVGNLGGTNGHISLRRASDGLQVGSLTVDVPNSKIDLQSGYGTLSLSTSGIEKVRIDQLGNLLLKSGTGALGYGTGAGGVVTQLTSKSMAVTFNKPSGRITMHNGALAAGATVSFVLYNTTMGPSDTLTLSIPNLISNDIFYYKVTHNLYNGGAIIFVTNASGSSLSEAISINFNVHKGAIS